MFGGNVNQSQPLLVWSMQTFQTLLESQMRQNIAAKQAALFPHVPNHGCMVQFFPSQDLKACAMNSTTIDTQHSYLCQPWTHLATSGDQIHTPWSDIERRDERQKVPVQDTAVFSKKEPNPQLRHRAIVTNTISLLLVCSADLRTRNRETCPRSVSSPL